PVFETGLATRRMETPQIAPAESREITDATSSPSLPQLLQEVAHLKAENKDLKKENSAMKNEMEEMRMMLHALSVRVSRVEHTERRLEDETGVVNHSLTRLSRKVDVMARDLSAIVEDNEFDHGRYDSY
ncbi:hypothetical protein PMAYCL1PPCAC_10986, partial [Pristionchus mayeri]